MAAGWGCDAEPQLTGSFPAGSPGVAASAESWEERGSSEVPS